jgi:hypothetical protein
MVQLPSSGGAAAAAGAACGPPAIGALTIGPDEEGAGERLQSAVAAKTTAIAPARMNAVLLRLIEPPDLPCRNSSKPAEKLLWSGKKSAVRRRFRERNKFALGGVSVAVRLTILIFIATVNRHTAVGVVTRTTLKESEHGSHQKRIVEARLCSDGSRETA